MNEQDDLPNLDQRIEQVLVLEAAGQHIVRGALEKIVDQLPDISLTEVGSIDAYSNHVKKDNYDVVIFDYDLCGDKGLTLIQELRLKEYDPAVLIVSSQIESKLFTQVYNQGLYRYIVKDGQWQEEVGPALRHLLRIRKLENENRKLLAKLTEANALLNEKNRRLDEFSATLAHDIRGPLGGICMKLDYVLDQYGKQFDERLFGLLDRARLSSERLTQIVQAMYDFAKLGHKATHMEQVSLVELVQNVTQDLSVDESLDIHLTIDEKLPVVWGNKELLARVFLNLIQNAVKYNDKAEIKIEIGVSDFKKRTLGDFASIFVRDNGEGIPKKLQKNIFQIFSRGTFPDNKNKEGLGIGLSVVQRIVELHFGKVSVDSILGEGSTFNLELPIEEISFATIGKD